MKTVAGLLISFMLCGIFHCAPPAHANPVCPYPTTNLQIEVNVIASGSGSWCLYPKEYTGSRIWCKEGAGGIGVNFGGNSNGVGAGTSGGIGGLEGDCAYRCDNGQLAFQPNPPGWWKYHIRRFLDCLPLNPDGAPFELPPPFPIPVDPRPIPAGLIDQTGMGDDSAQTGVSIDPVKPNPASLSPRGR